MSQQHIVLNEFDTRTQFYKLFPAEEVIRTWANHTNCYFVTLFACCRSLYDPRNHSTCIEANSSQEAIEKFKNQKGEEEIKKKTESDKDE